MKKSKKMLIGIVILVLITICVMCCIKCYEMHNDKHQVQNEDEDKNAENELPNWPNEESKEKEITMTREECLQTLTTEEIVKLLEERAPEAGMDLICQKLRNYAKGLGENVQYGIITLSEGEMVSIRNFLKSKEADDGETLLRWAGGVSTWNSDYILGYEHDEGINIMGIGIWDYQGYKFVLHCNRNLLYLDSDTRKIIAITNSVDYPNDNYSELETLIWGNAPNNRQDKPCTLQTTSECSFTYLETETGTQIEKWTFGEKLHTWYGEKISGQGLWDIELPVTVELNGEQNGTHFVNAKGNLLSFKEGEDKIRLIAKEIEYPEGVVTACFSKNTVYYAHDNEVHMVCTETYEDILLAEDFETELQATRSVGSYAIYHDKDRKAHVAAGYFDENNKAVIGEKETVNQAHDYEEKVMRSLVVN